MIEQSVSGMGLHFMSRYTTKNTAVFSKHFKKTDHAYLVSVNYKGR